MKIKKSIVRKCFTILWLAVGVATIVLLVAAVQQKNAKHCSGISVNIEGVSNNFFVDKKDILNIIKSSVGGDVANKSIVDFNLRQLETELEKDTWVKTAQLFFDNNNRLMVKVVEREPIARVFTLSNTTFYVDSSLAILPLSEKFSARLPVFTGFPSDKRILSKLDSALLKMVVQISMAIQKDPFRMAMIEQVDITSERQFELMPKLGNAVVVFGDANDIEAKFSKLQLFYQHVAPKVGWNKYSVINLQYKNQVVAKIKGAEDQLADSVRTLQLLQQIAQDAETKSNDSLHLIAQDNEENSTNVSLVMQSMQRDEGQMQPNATVLVAPVFQPLPTVVATKKVVVAAPPQAVTAIKTPAVGNAVTTVAKPIAKPVVKPAVPLVAKPADKAAVKMAAPVVVKPKAKPVAEKPKALLPKAANSEGVKKPVNEY